MEDEALLRLCMQAESASKDTPYKKAKVSHFHKHPTRKAEKVIFINTLQERQKSHFIVFSLSLSLCGRIEVMAIYYYYK